MPPFFVAAIAPKTCPVRIGSMEARIANPSVRPWRYALALVMVLAGVLHFLFTDDYVSVMPDYLPWHEELVLISGFFEIAGGLGLLIPATRTFAGWGLIALYVAVLPANINMAVHDIQPARIAIPLWLLWLRIPLQAVFIYWAWAVSQPDN